MSQNLRNYLRACYALDAVARRVPADKWDAQSPCAEWTAEGVLDHSIDVAHMVTVAAGGPGDAGAGDGAALGRWHQAFDALHAQLDSKGVLQRVSETPFGEMPVDNFLGVLGVDPLLHTWDLAQAAGLDHGIDEGLAVQCQQGLAALGDMIRGPGRFDPAVTAPAGADAVTKLAAFSGRQV